MGSKAIRRRHLHISSKHLTVVKCTHDYPHEYAECNGDGKARLGIDFVSAIVPNTHQLSISKGLMFSTF